MNIQASGLVGKTLTEYFGAKGIKIIQISQSSRNSKAESYLWNPFEGQFDDFAALEGVDAVVHLAGENVASGEGILSILGRWSDSKKQVYQ